MSNSSSLNQEVVEVMISSGQLIAIVLPSNEGESCKLR
jgi:hypothetical protein